jgi:caffeoyl-CoA O-methyltransferase
VLEETLISSQVAGLPPHNVSLTQGRMLQILVELKSAKRVLKIRTLGGYSTIFFGCALLITASNGLSASKLIILEKSLKYAALDGLSELIAKSEPVFDVVFINADKINNTEYYKKAMQLSK